MRNKKKYQALLCGIIPGGGQIYNKQYSKAIFFSGAFILELIFTITFGANALIGLITLGSIPMVDNSMFMLVRGSLAIIVYALFTGLYILSLHDAYKIQQSIENGEEVGTNTREIIRKIWVNGFPYLISLPAYLLMSFVIIFPVLVTLFIAFTNYDLAHTPPANLIDWVGFENFFKLFIKSSFKSAFFDVLKWTLIWTFFSSTLSVSLGVFVAIIANQPWIKGQRFFRTIFLLPWAVPAFVTILTFSNMFNDSFGAINVQILPLINRIPFVEIAQIPWKTSANWTKVAMILIQTWLGFPYIYVMVTGVLQSIPGDLYEAARIDGAGAMKRFQKITLPMILFSTAPVMITQYTFNFNNFSMIYLFNQGGPGVVGGGAGSTDILISWVYKLTTSGKPDYALAAAVTLLISTGLIIASLLGFKYSNAFDKEDMM
ncbi:sugar transporter subunit [Erysipelotrichaceae bacterium]|nr:sugar transporter subunit [Erysipelotrichaceae bacterium]